MRLEPKPFFAVVGALKAMMADLGELWDNQSTHTSIEGNGKDLCSNKQRLRQAGHP
jgi:hypothetical protein